MDLTRKKQVVKWQTSPVSVLKLRHCSLYIFWNALVSSQSWRLNVSSRSWEFGKMERLGLVSVLWLNVLWTSLSRCDIVYLFYLYHLSNFGTSFNRSAENKYGRYVYWDIAAEKAVVFTARPHCSQCKRCNSYRISVCPSVRRPVRQVPVFCPEEWRYDHMRSSLSAR